MIKNTLIAKYLKERGGTDILENEFGFISYRFSGSDCFICDMYVDSDQRGKSVGRNLIADLNKIALGAGSKRIIANVHLQDPGATNTLGAAFMVGFKLLTAENNIISISKMVEE